jgi:hypothetical protein
MEWIKKRFLYKDIYKMPVYNWFKVMSENNFGYLHKSSTFNVDEIEHDNTQLASDTWFKLMNQYFKEFGQDESTISLLEKKRDIGLLQTEYITTLNKFLLTQIEIKQSALNVFDTDEAFDYNREVGIISKYLGKPINIKEISVAEYNVAKKSLQNTATNG